MDTAREWCKAVIVAAHRSYKRGMVFILDTQNQQRATVVIPDDPDNFFIKFYGVDAMGKVVDEYSRGKCHLKKRWIKMI